MTSCGKDEPRVPDVVAEEPVEDPEPTVTELSAFNNEVTTHLGFINPDIIDPPDEQSSEPARSTTLYFNGDGDAVTANLLIEPLE